MKYIIVAAVIGGLLLIATRTKQTDMENDQIVVEGVLRTYLVFHKSNQGPNAPLVLVLHGGGGNSRQMERHTRFNKVAEEEGFIVCYPDAYEKYWNDGRDVDSIESHRKNINDVQFIKSLITEICNKYPVDKSRIYVTGISNGAFMAHRLANEASDIISAIAPVVGGIAEPIFNDFRPKNTVSLFVIQSDTDPLVPFNGGGVGARGSRGNVISTKDTISKYMELNNIQDDPVVTTLPDIDKRTTVNSYVYPTGDRGSIIQFYLVKNGGHTWAGTDQIVRRNLVGTICKDFDATSEIWKFFKSCPPREN